MTTGVNEEWKMEKSCSVAARTGHGVHIDLDTSTLIQWRRIGDSEGLRNDSEIASFLTRLYFATQRSSLSAACCIQCHSPLTVFCIKCQRPSQTPPALTVCQGDPMLLSSADACTRDGDEQGTGAGPNDTQTTSGNHQSADPVSQVWNTDLVKSEPTLTLQPDIQCPTTTMRSEDSGSVPINDRSTPSGVRNQSPASSRMMYDGTQCADDAENEHSFFPSADNLSVWFSENYNEGQADIGKNTVSESQAQCQRTEVFVCDVCQASFTKSSILKQHMQIHSGDRPYKCQICSIGYTQAIYLKQHMCTHTGQKKHVCKICCRAFALSSTLTVHIRTHVRLRCEKCRLCSEVFRKVNSLQAHMVQKHKGEKAYSCGVCGFGFDRRCDLNKHTHIHTGYKPHLCSVCGSGFGDKSMLTQHMRTHTGERPFCCEVCCKTFTTRCSIRRHQRIHRHNKPAVDQSEVNKTKVYNHAKMRRLTRSRGQVAQGDQSVSDTEKSCDAETREMSITQHDVAGEPVRKTSPITDTDQYVCSKCPASFWSERDLKHHQQSHQQHACKLCGVAYKRPMDVRRHMKSHRAPKSYMCNVCSKVFKTYREYKNHPQTHACNRRYTCQVCDTRCGCPSALRTHMRTHTGEKPFVCEICSKAFAYSAGLKAHMEGHQDNKSYMCEVCGIGFTRVGSLTSHMRTHTGQRPYACEVCNATFAQGTTLKRHMYTHTGERPYACELCSKTYTTPGALTRHKQAHNNARTYVCNVCGMAFNTSIVLKQHIMGRHSTDKPHKCSQCDYAAALKGHLTLHMATHSDLKPYVCQVCGCAFKKARGLRKHEKIHTRDKPLTCDICGASFERQAHLTIHRKFHIQPH